MKYREAVIEAEAQHHEGGYTLGAFNRQDHASIEGNAKNPDILSHQSGHLQRDKRGVRKIEERDCLICLDTGLNDGQWHTLPASLPREHNLYYLPEKG